MATVYAVNKLTHKRQHDYTVAEFYNEDQASEHAFNLATDMAQSNFKNFEDYHNQTIEWDEALEEAQTYYEIEIWEED